MSGKFTMRRSGTRRITMAVKHHVGSREIAIVLLTKGDEGAAMTRTEVLDLVRSVAQEHGGQGLFPDCGVDVEGYEGEFAAHARWASDTVRRLWPDLDDDELRQFDEQYIDYYTNNVEHLNCWDCGAPKAEDSSTMPGVDLCGEYREKTDARVDA